MKKFAKITSALLALLMAASAVFMTGCDEDVPTNDPADTGDKTETKSDIIVQTNAYFAPFEYYDGTEIKGVDVDIMNKVGTKLGRKVVFENVEFGVIVDNVSKGEICDCGAAGITITEPRKEQVDFSVPYYTSVQYVVYKKGTMEIDGTSESGEKYILWDSLAGKLIGVQADTTGDIYVDGQINATEDNEDYGYNGVLYGSGAEASRFDNAQLAVDAIGANQIDVVVIDQLPASYIVSKNADYEAVALYYKGAEGEADSPTSEEYAICVTKGNTELLDAINAVLNEMLANVDETTGQNEVEKLVAQHFGIDD